ncbi:MAG: T9SS type B sorting domain-containing protein [Bacteroidota bacterium]
MKKKILLLFILFSSLGWAQENCNNGIDDDGDGMIDLNDSECVCNATSTVSSIIPSPSFEDHSGCPDAPSELEYATPWIQATTNATSDYMNNCGFVFPSITDIGLGNFPDGDGIVGAIILDNYKEYIGTTLLSTMQAGTNYQFTLNIASLMVASDASTPIPFIGVAILEPVNITLYGCNNGANIPVVTATSPDLADPTWIEIGHVTYTPSSTWNDITILVTPTIDINAIMIGGPTVVPPSYESSNLPFDAYPYFVFDSLILNKADAFGVNVTQSGNFCDTNLVLTANITTTVSPGVTYQWYKDGIAIIGATNSTYLVPNGAVNLGNYSVKVTDGTSCYVSSTATVNSTIPGPNYIAIQPNCTVITGSITVTTPAAEYSFDGGITWQTSPTKNLLPIGIYYIKIKTATGCTSSSNAVIIINSQQQIYPDFTSTDPTNCTTGGSITITTPAAEYSFDGGVTWTTNPMITNLPEGTYYIKIKDSMGCVSAESIVYIYSSFTTAPAPNYMVSQPNCSISTGTITITTVSSTYSFDNGITWVTSNVAANLPSGNYTIRVKDSNGCISDSNFVTINPSFGTLSDPVSTTIQPFCSLQTGTITITSTASEYSFDNGLTWQVNNIKANLIPGAYQIKVKDSNGCISNAVTETIILYVFPSPPVLDLQQKFCEQNNPTLNDINATALNIKWYNSQTGGVLLPLTTPLVFGTTYYTSQTLADGCESLRVAFLVVGSNKATISQIVTTDWTDNNNTITVLVSDNSIGDYEYSLDGIVFQDSNIFTGLESGVYTVTVRDKNGCGIINEDVYLLVYPKFFTPNGDGYNDFWSIKYSRFEPGLKIKILDRYGKFIKELNYNETWDGTYNGVPLFSTDYWFVVYRANGKEHRGHFSMKR